MISWADVSEKDWFYNEVMEASNYLMGDGEPFIQGIAYGSFESNAPYLYEEQNGAAGQKVFTVQGKITPSADNPLFVFVDGTQTLYKEIRVNPNDPNKTDIELYYAPPAGSVVAFSSLGKPALDRFGKPIPPIHPPLPIPTNAWTTETPITTIRSAVNSTNTCTHMAELCIESMFLKRNGNRHPARSSPANTSV